MALGLVDLSVSRDACPHGLSDPRQLSNRIYNAVALAGIAVFYFPESTLRRHGKSTRAILGKIDYVGAFLSITGLTLL